MNDARLNQILQEYGPTIRRYLQSKCNDPDDVEDLYQECTCAIFEALPKFEGRSSISTWIVGICRNVFSNYVYYRQRDRNLKDRLQTRETHHDLEERLELSLLIEKLPELLRQVHKLYYLEGRTVREISATLGKAEGTVKYLLHQLRAELREMLS
ncbi:MAG: sigma-70 family RNA polymerase sigma factor [SAR324 cluster bacterium]|jgi:RNA polymerase sigma-70 factor (ECF subfamily)|nr:sigma-70 family RNA polymerase sigma factor [SAR324 cluster bacterium]